MSKRCRIHCDVPPLPGMRSCPEHATKDEFLARIRDQDEALTVALTPETLDAAQATATVTSVLAVLARYDHAQARRGMAAHDALKTLAGEARADRVAAAHTAGFREGVEACAAMFDRDAADDEASAAESAGEPDDATEQGRDYWIKQFADGAREHRRQAARCRALLPGGAKEGR